MKYSKHSNLKIEQFLKTFEQPEGYTKVVSDFSYGAQSPKMRRMVLTNETEGIRFSIDFFPSESAFDKKHHGAFTMNGHTDFKSEPGREDYNCTFDRRGISDSFYLYEKKHELLETLTLQTKRVAESREYQRTAVRFTIRRQSFSLAPDTLNQFKKQLAAGRSVQFHPPGMGIGYSVSIRSTRWSEPVEAETCKVFGQARLFAESMDCD